MRVDGRAGSGGREYGEYGGGAGGARSDIPEGRNDVPAEISLHARPQTIGTRGKVTRARERVGTGVPRRLCPAFLFLSPSLFLSSSPPPRHLSSFSSSSCGTCRLGFARARELDRFRDGAKINGGRGGAKTGEEAHPEDRERENTREEETRERGCRAEGKRWSAGTSHVPSVPSVAPLRQRRCSRATRGSSQGHHMLGTRRYYRTTVALIVLDTVPVARRRILEPRDRYPPLSNRSRDKWARASCRDGRDSRDGCCRAEEKKKVSAREQKQRGERNEKLRVSVIPRALISGTRTSSLKL